jgi:hypothetical protein
MPARIDESATYKSGRDLEIEIRRSLGTSGKNP